MRLLAQYEKENALTNAAIRTLRHRLGLRFISLPSSEIIRRANLVRLTRESDTYAALYMRKQKAEHFFLYKGIEYLREACRLDRPVVLLSSHMGSLYTTFIALPYKGFPVHTVARAVDRSPATPRAQQMYISLNYRITGMKMTGKYLFTNFSGGLQRSIINVFTQKRICFNAIDIPSSLYPHKREAVMFLETPSSLPSGFIHWAQKKEAIFLTLWSGVEINEDKARLRWIDIGPPIETKNVKSILQEYSDRLTEAICKEPWQWMALPIAEQYNET